MSETATVSRWYRNREANLEYKRRYYREHREEILLKAKDRNSDPRRRARVKVQSRVKRHRIIKPECCSRCSIPTEARSLHAHHEDHGKPLEIVWLCRRCHGEVHRKTA